MFRTKKKDQTEYEDDGRTIADMNIDGMPWYVRGDERRSRGSGESGGSQLTDEELRMYKFAALKSALLVVLVFAVVFFLFIAFCDFIWFK